MLIRMDAHLVLFLCVYVCVCVFVLEDTGSAIFGMETFFGFDLQELDSSSFHSGL